MTGGQSAGVNQAGDGVMVRTKESGMEYNVLVEFDELSDDEAERVLTDMSGWHPSIGWCPHGRPRVTVTVDGLTVRGAGDWGLSEVERFVGRRARSVEVLPTADFDARAGV